MSAPKVRDVTGASWAIPDVDGDYLVVYAPQADLCAIGTQKSGSTRGFAAVLGPAALDKLIAELRARRARMP